MKRVYYLETELIDNTEVIKGAQYIHNAVLDVEGTLRKLIQDTTNTEHTGLIAVAVSWREANTNEIAQLATLPDIESVPANQLPHSTISAVVKSIASDKLSCIITQTYQGKKYDIKANLTKLTAEKLGKQPGINAGDTVLVTYVDHAPIGTLPIIVDSIAAIVYP